MFVELKLREPEREKKNKDPRQSVNVLTRQSQTELVCAKTEPVTF